MVLILSIKKIWSYLNSTRRSQLILLLILMLMTSVAEVISIGAVVPFLGSLANAEVIFNYPSLQPIINFLGISEYTELLLPLTVIFISASIFAGLMRISLLWVQIRLSQAIGADLGYHIYQVILKQPYEDHASQNSSETIATISVKVNQVTNQVIKPIMVIISSFIIFTVMVAFLIYLSPFVAISTIFSLAVIYTTILFFTKAMLFRNSKIINAKTNLVIKLLQEGLGGIRNVILGDLQNLYSKAFHLEDLKLRRASSNNQIISQSPRFVIEALGMVIIALVAYKMGTETGEFSSIVPVLGAFAFGAQRILPLVQHAYGSLTSINGTQVVFYELMRLARKSNNKTSKIHGLVFKKSIKINDLSFNYKNRKTKILKGINIEITKGARIGFIGETGSGKSTLLDVIMCLLSPVEGGISVDGIELNLDNSHEWYNHLSHIPQSIFLIDDTITRNIAFGISDKEINHSRVAEAAKQAGISDTIELLDFKYESIVGERGTRLSGGQRQRIGIARALYNQSDVLIFDEATSALDEKTENLVMKEIYNIDKEITIIMVSHRISTMKNCDLIYELDAGQVKWSGTYEDLVNRKF
jgi:ABC-type bacteriocin/lantibiotic exporter with double-glycine peptidase domain